MVLEVEKQERETGQSLVRRFTRRMQQSGVLHKVRQNRFHKRVKSKNAVKEAALRREESRKEYARMKKMSKPEERSSR